MVWRLLAHTDQYVWKSGKFLTKEEYESLDNILAPPPPRSGNDSKAMPTLPSALPSGMLIHDHVPAVFVFLSHTLLPPVY